MFYLRLIRRFIIVSIHEMAAYRSNFWISALNGLLELGAGMLALVILFEQVETFNGWTLPGVLALLGVYLTLGALRALFIGPSLEALAGMDGEVWSGKLDFTLVRPVDVQFLASFRTWRPLKLLDLVLGLGVLFIAVVQLEHSLTFADGLSFIIALVAGLLILYAILLAFAGLVFWSPGFLFTWLFDAFFQMARYPVGLYPVWLRLVLTWVIPVGLMTTVPAQALAGDLSPLSLLSSLLVALLFLAGATAIFRKGLRRYASASS